MSGDNLVKLFGLKRNGFPNDEFTRFLNFLIFTGKLFFVARREFIYVVGPCVIILY